MRRAIRDRASKKGSDGKMALVTDDRVNPRELKRFREALRLAMRATMTTLQAQMDALHALRNLPGAKTPVVSKPVSACSSRFAICV